jgi:hypothetical protein
MIGQIISHYRIVEELGGGTSLLAGWKRSKYAFLRNAVFEGDPMINPKTQKQPQSNDAVGSKGSQAKVMMMPNAPSHDTIRERAYELYESRGREPGPRRTGLAPCRAGYPQTGATDRIARLVGLRESRGKSDGLRNLQ